MRTWARRRLGVGTDGGMLTSIISGVGVILLGCIGCDDGNIT